MANDKANDLAKVRRIANRQLLDMLTHTLDRWPNMRFAQALEALGMVADTKLEPDQQLKQVKVNFKKLQTFN